jgi:uncharacterized RDD family membrane protein YckC
VAYIVDVLIVAAIVTVITLVLAIPVALMGGTGPTNTLSPGEASFVVLIIIAVLVVSLGYFPWFWARSGSTPGMRMNGLRVVRDTDGGPLTGGQALLRLVGFWVSGAVFYLGFIWIFIDQRHRGWADLIAGTLVVKQA